MKWMRKLSYDMKHGRLSLAVCFNRDLLFARAAFLFT